MYNDSDIDRVARRMIVQLGARAADRAAAIAAVIETGHQSTQHFDAELVSQYENAE